MEDQQNIFLPLRPHFNAGIITPGCVWHNQCCKPSQTPILFDNHNSQYSEASRVIYENPPKGNKKNHIPL